MSWGQLLNCKTCLLKKDRQFPFVVVLDVPGFVSLHKSAESEKGTEEKAFRSAKLMATPHFAFLTAVCSSTEPYHHLPGYRQEHGVYP